MTQSRNSDLTWSDALLIALIFAVLLAVFLGSQVLLDPDGTLFAQIDGTESLDTAQTVCPVSSGQDLDSNGYRIPHRIDGGK